MAKFMTMGFNSSFQEAIEEITKTTLPRYLPVFEKVKKCLFFNYFSNLKRKDFEKLKGIKKKRFKRISSR